MPGEPENHVLSRLRITTQRQRRKPNFHQYILLWLAWLFFQGFSVLAADWEPDGLHVFPGDDLQAALDAAGANPTNKTILVHPGVYRPERRRQALIWFNRVHDGVQFKAVGEATLTAANPNLSEAGQPGCPAVVNHVVYFGDGISSNTLLEGFTITGANHFVTKAPPEIESSRELERNLFFYADGGGIKVFGRSFPRLRRLRVLSNYASPCAGGISVQHVGVTASRQGPAVRIEDCLFIENRAQITGAAVDLLPGSSAVISNCLFQSNVANLGENYISQRRENPEFTNSAPLTVFPGSRAVVQRCTFTRNRNAAEDLGELSEYQDCIFWANNQGKAFYGGARYELNVQSQAKVTGCHFGGPVLDPNGKVSKQANSFDAPDPNFDSRLVPLTEGYEHSGFRPPTSPEGRALFPPS